MVDELDRCGTRATLGAIHHNEIGRDAGDQHGLDHCKPFPRVANAQLEAGGFAAREAAQTLDELHHFYRC